MRQKLIILLEKSRNLMKIELIVKGTILIVKGTILNKNQTETFDGPTKFVLI